MKTEAQPPLEHVAGVLALELANSIPDRSADASRDWLIDPGVEVWAESVGLPALEEPTPEHRADMVELREVIHRVFAPIAEGALSETDAVTALTRVHADGLLRFGFRAAPGGVSRRWPDIAGADDRLARIATSGIDLLVGERIGRVRECPGCGWLFIDESRNHSRRWCSMRTCGNRSKARRHLVRARTAGVS